MNKHLTQEDIRALSVEERLRLIEDLWASLDGADADALPLPGWHETVVNDRLAAHERDPDAAQSWDDVKSDLLGRLRK